MTLTRECFAAALGGWLSLVQAPAGAAPAVPTSAPAVETAADACRGAGAWDAACLRERYRGAPAQWPRPAIDAGVDWQELGPVPAEAPQPAENPATAEKIALGRSLFFDPRLSRKGELSCASCHRPDRAFTDGRALAVGEDRLQGRRRSQPLLGAPFAPRLFWDGRAATLEEQVLMPIANPVEMAHPVNDTVARLAALDEYRAPFKAAFGDPTPDATALARALAAFVRTLRPEPSAFDRFLAGDRAALNDQALVGLHLFRTKARCMNCHNGPMLTDQRFHDIGLSFYGRRNQDLGRYEITRDKADLGAFRTPSLRNVAKAGPWMHNGLLPDLKGLVRLYNGGMGTVVAVPDDAYAPRKSALIRKLDLDADEIDALTAWLQSL